MGSVVACTYVFQYIHGQINENPYLAQNHHNFTHSSLGELLFQKFNHTMFVVVKVDQASHFLVEEFRPKGEIQWIAVLGNICVMVERNLFEHFFPIDAEGVDGFE